MIWLRALAVWALMMAVETLNGIGRTLLVVPLLGDLQARQAALPLAAGLILLVAVATSRWLNAAGCRTQFAVGVLWAALTLLFEVALGLAQGFSVGRIAAEYNPSTGGFMAFALAFMACSPWLAARIRGAKTQRDGQ